jgi:hypothetical protein
MRFRLKVPGKRSGSCGRQMSLLRTTFLGMLVISSPSILTVPCVGSSSRRRMDKMVLFPLFRHQRHSICLSYGCSPPCSPTDSKMLAFFDLEADFLQCSAIVAVKMSKLALEVIVCYKLTYTVLSDRISLLSRWAKSYPVLLSKLRCFRSVCSLHMILSWQYFLLMSPPGSSTLSPAVVNC